jgi:hypothetical protein
VSFTTERAPQTYVYSTFCCARDARPVFGLTGNGSGTFLRMFGKAGNRFATMSKCFQRSRLKPLLPPQPQHVN